MKNATKKIIKFIIIYLIVSSMYIGACINFETPIYYEGYEETSIFYNIFRIIMGVPKVYRGYKGVSPKFLIEIIIKLIIAIILIVYLIKNHIENKKIENEQIKQKKCLISIIGKMFVNMLLIFIYLVFLYATYAGIHWIR